MVLKRLNTCARLRMSCPPHYHLQVAACGAFLMDALEKVHYSRISIHVFFTGAATAFCRGFMAVLLSGANTDIVQAMTLVKERGERNIVQHPEEEVKGFMHGRPYFYLR